MTEEQAVGVATRADVTLATVMRRLLGWAVRTRSGARVDDELAKMGFRPPPVPAVQA